MKQRNLKKKAGALLLAATMTVNLFPILGSEVYAAELPDTSQFATVDDLKSFDTDDTNKPGTPAAKIYFGNNNQQWWIAGSQNDGSMTLFAASPLATGQVFEANYRSDKTYDTGWRCAYPDGAPTDVYPSHYGASPLRTRLQSLESSYFTSAEQSLMNNTTIYTDDTKNSSSSVYSTTEKLYLAYGNYNDQYITVGTNNSNSLNGGLHIDKGYWGNAGDFWLRAPNFRLGVCLAGPGLPYVDIAHVYDANALVPAFELNLSSVIFASAAPAAVSGGNLAVDTNAMTLRYNSDSLGSARVTYDYTKVNVTGVPSGAYLVAQNKDGAWAKAVSGEASVSASEMGTGFTSFENCKVWLEKTNSSERKTYATRVRHDVHVVPGTGMQVQSGNLMQQVDDGQSMTDIVIKAESGYMFPADYSAAGQNGITVTKNSDSQITVSGTPTADVSLTLPAATQKVYGMNLSGDGTFGSACVEYAPDKAAAREFTITNTGNMELTNVDVTVGGTDSGAFALTWDTTATVIQPNGKIKVTVKPTDNLAVKEYQAQLSVSADNCNTVSKTLQFKVMEHDYNDIITPPSCTQKGYTTHTCPNCGDTYTDSETDMIPHPFGEWENIQAPTCEQGGSRRHVCTVCGYSETENLDSNGHKWEDTPTVDREPTCQNDGSQSIHCKNCDATKDSQPLSRVDHKYTNYVSNHDATCTKDGTKTASCDLGCGSTNTLPDDGSMLEHDYEWTYNNDAACEKNGTETGVCKDCGDKTTREKAGTALKHQPGDWIVDKEATETTDGTKHKECTVCGEVLETETIPATGTEAEKQGTPTTPGDSEKGDSTAARSPQTGDNTDAALWALLLVLSVLLMAFAVQIRKRETYLKHKRK